MSGQEEPVRLDDIRRDDAAVERARSGEDDSQLAADLRRWISS